MLKRKNQLSLDLQLEHADKFFASGEPVTGKATLNAEHGILEIDGIEFILEGQMPKGLSVINIAERG